jgi:hypothetical protein
MIRYLITSVSSELAVSPTADATSKLPGSLRFRAATEDDGARHRQRGLPAMTEPLPPQA